MSYGSHQFLFIVSQEHTIRRAEAISQRVIIIGSGVLGKIINCIQKIYRPSQVIQKFLHGPAPFFIRYFTGRRAKDLRKFICCCVNAGALIVFQVRQRLHVFLCGRRKGLNTGGRSLIKAGAQGMEQSVSQAFDKAIARNAVFYFLPSKIQTLIRGGIQGDIPAKTALLSQ